MSLQQSPARRPERRRLRTALLGGATAILVAFGGMVALPAAANAAEGTVADATLEWGVRASFRNYIYNFAAFEGKTALLGTTTQPVEKGVYNWSGGAGSAQEDGTAADVGYGKGNGVHFQSHPMTVDGNKVYSLHIKFTNPRVVITGAKTGELRMDVVGREFKSMTEVGPEYTLDDVALASLALPEPTIANGAVTFTAVPATLTEGGAKAFGGFYNAGESLDPVTFTLPVKVPVAPAAETATKIAVAPASPAVLGAETTLTATVEPATATGSIQFFDGEKSLGAPVKVTEGKAELRTSALAAGGHVFRAAYTPEGNFIASQSAPTKHFGVVDPAEHAVCTPSAGAEQFTGVTARWAYSDYSNAGGHAGGTYQMAKFASGNVTVDDKDFVLSEGTAAVSKDCTSISFSGTMRVEAYQSFFPTHGQWIELVDPVLALDAKGNGTWTAGVRSGVADLNTDAAPRTVVATVNGASVPNFLTDTVATSVDFAYEGTVTSGSWSAERDSAWSNSFILRVPAAIRAFYYASGAGADASKPASPLRVDWKWDAANAIASVRAGGEAATEVQQGQKVVFTAGPFARNAKVSAEVRSEPVSLGEITTDGNGVATTEWTVPADFEVGEHTVVFTDGAGNTARAAFSVKAANVKTDPTETAITVPSGGGTKSAPALAAAAAAKGGLAKTGSEDSAGLLLAGGAALLLGAGLMMRRQLQR